MKCISKLINCFQCINDLIYVCMYHSLIKVFLYKVAAPELKISPIMYFLNHNSVVLSIILKIIVPFRPLLSMQFLTKLMNFISQKLFLNKIYTTYGTVILGNLEQTIKLYMEKYILGEIYSSSEQLSIRNLLIKLCMVT